VILKSKSNNQELIIPLEELSETDQKHIEFINSSNKMIPAVVRTWTNNNGKFSVQAKYISADENKVTLEKEDGTKITVEISKLSQEDRDYVKRQLESETKIKKNELPKP
jgi:hypothetical protein